MTSTATTSRSRTTAKSITPVKSGLQVLWDLTWMLIEKHGFSSNLNNHTGGQNVALDLVLGGMKLQPANPSFIEARGRNHCGRSGLDGGPELRGIVDRVRPPRIRVLGQLWSELQFH